MFEQEGEHIEDGLGLDEVKIIQDKHKRDSPLGDCIDQHIQ